MNGHAHAQPRLALLCVSDKTGLVEFARGLITHGYALLSTGGTAATLKAAGLAVTEVADHTGFPEMMSGRVKTLHPRIHGGLLGRAGDDAVMKEHGIPRIQLAVINLYPFEAITNRLDCSFDEAIENIDIGGPALVRSAAKNHASVGVVTSPDQYPEVLGALERGAGELDDATRYALAVAAFDRIARYDAAISNYLSSRAGTGEKSAFPGQLNATFRKIMDLRYGENPHQAAAWYVDAPGTAGLSDARQLQGKELSFNNIADADAAWACVQTLSHPACVIVKHGNPCGAAQAEKLQSAYEQAYATDATSAFGGIIACSGEVDAATAEAILGRQFLEVLIAPSFSDAALRVLARKPNVRLLAVPAGAPGEVQLDFKRVQGGLLVQTADAAVLSRKDCRVVSRIAPTEAQWDDLLFAWKIVKMVKSNAIVFAARGQTLGIGAGQMSRVDATRIARWKAGEAGFDLRGSALASDAFFPFRDGIDTAAPTGISCVIHPGGSMRDEEVIAAADEHGLAMVFTGMRHFRH